MEWIIRPSRRSFRSRVTLASCWGSALIFSTFPPLFCSIYLRSQNISGNFLSTMSTSPSNWDYSIHSIRPSESQEAAQVYRALRADIARIEEGDSSTKSLILLTNEIIKEFSARPESDSVFTYGIGRDGEERPSLNLDKVLTPYCRRW